LKTGLHLSFTRKTSIAILLALVFIGQAVFAGTHNTNKRRKGGRGGGRGYSDFEVFQHNFDLFIGPSYNMASGPFVDNGAESLKSNNTAYKYTDKASKNFISAMVGIQYRFFMNPKADGFLSNIAFGTGILYQRRGFTHDLEMINKSISLFEDKININEKFRANYLSIPLSLHIGKQFFGMVGATVDILASGSMTRDLERGTWGDSSSTVYFSTYYKQEFKTGNVQPKISLGYCFGAGYNFNENSGIRFFGTLGNNYFTKGSDFENLQLSIQLIATLN
jgi:hypothetical protein